MPRIKPQRPSADPTGALEDPAEYSEPEGRATRSQPRSDRRSHQEVSREQKHVRPDEVSHRVWSLAEQWLAEGVAHFGKRPPVNKQDFSRRLSDKINSDKNLRKWMAMPPSHWQKKFPGRWDSGEHFVENIVSRMIQLFYEYLTVEQQNTSLLQFDFLEDEWDEWVYHATTSVQVSWYKTQEWNKPKGPTGVFEFNRHTVGQPADDEPCSDPAFEGMTWGEVRALDDSHLLSERTEEPEPRYQSDRIATIKRAIVANRHHIVQEDTDAEQA